MERAKRLFIALNLSDEIKDIINEKINTLKNEIKDVKWADRDGLHITLHFLGDTDQNLENDLKKEMALIKNNFSPIEFELEKIGAFPSLQSPRVIFAGSREINGCLALGLHKGLGRIISRLGLNRDERPWTPHITLGRVKIDIRSPHLSTSLPPLRFSIKSWELMESMLGPAGSKYHIVQSYELR
jgi:RNA 2',3'-cyclic 3'-phosphodiesterase